MTACTSVQNSLDSRTVAFYCDAANILKAAGVEFVVGGAYAYERYTGIARHTKDFDVFVRRADVGRALAALAAQGYRTEITFAHWLAKARFGDDMLDIIFSSGNGIAEVDDGWFAHAVEADVLGLPLKLSPPEEMIWSKAFVMERERYDGGDIAHLLEALADRLDWDRLLARFGDHWRVLLSHLVLFGFIYPCHRARIPARVMRELVSRLEKELAANDPLDPVCQGTILSRSQYRSDVEERGYEDARLTPRGRMTAEHIACWTAASE